VAGPGRLGSEIRRGALGTELLKILRTGADGPAKRVWSVSLTAESAPPLEPGLDQETILGDYLRIVHDCLTDESRQLELGKYLRDGLHDEELAQWAMLDDLHTRQRVLRHAAALGLDLLS
jgi:hypothetical protein